jgi:TonB-dependent receptor
VVSRLLPVILLSALSTSAASAGTITGHVFDRSSREQVIGASLSLNDGRYHTITSLDGRFSFKNIPAGTYTLHLTSSGYLPVDTLVTLTDNQVAEINFFLDPKASDLKVINISGHTNGETDAFAQRKEKTSNNIINIVSANAIAISPDITVSNVMQRISGVSVERSGTGDGQHAIIRGMDKRYNTTLINGIKIPSPDNKNRYVPLDIFPAEMVDRIEVIKSLTPELEGDAAGGVVNLVMKSAPSNLRIEGNLATGYSQIFFDHDYFNFSKSGIQRSSPAEKLPPGTYSKVGDFPVNNLLTSAGKAPMNLLGGITIGDRFLKDKLGVIFSGSYQNSYRGAFSHSLVQSPTVPPVSGPDQPQNPAFSDIQVRNYSYQISRLGTQLRMDYQLNRKHSLSLFATYVQLNEQRTRNTIDSTLGGYSFNNYVGSFAVYDRVQTRLDLQQIFNTTLQGRDLFGKQLSTDWSLVYSRASRQLPDIAEFSRGHQITPDINNEKLLEGPDYVRTETREWIGNTDQDLAGYLNMHYPLHALRRRGKSVLAFGGMYRQKKRDNYDNRYKLTPQDDPGTNDQLYKSIPDSRFTFIPSNDALGNAAGNAGIYTFNEGVGAAYAQITANYQDKWEWLAGVRAEHTYQHFESSLPVTVDGKFGTITYTDILPSVHAKYAFTPNKALRFSYFKSIYRPAYADLIPFLDNSSNENYATTGNPHLQHTKIDNLDIRYEYFGKGLDQYMIGAFYKFIRDPIEYAISQNGFTEQELKPNNFGNAQNFGLELVFRKFFGNFGVSGNYTYIHSIIRSGKNVYYIDAGGNTVNTTVPQSRPLQGQSAHIANFSLLYKSVKGGFEAQVALVYTGARINTLSLYRNLDNWERATTFLDVSVQKSIGRYFTLFAKANNLLNTPFQLVIKQPNNSYTGSNKLPFQQSSDYRTVQFDQYHSNYILGVRFKFFKSNK